MIIATWNVLHRIHAVNWETPALGAWADEQQRIDAIATMVGAWLESGTDVVCLQEVSGDQLVRLRALDGCDVHAFAYARVPTYWRRQEPPALDAPEEHLVVLVRGGGARTIHAEAFPTDPGKGLLAVSLTDGTRVVSTHVSHDKKRGAQLARLVQVAAVVPDPIAICGDFNAERSRCASVLGADFACARPDPDALATRPRERIGAVRGQDIDHVFVRGLDVKSARVIDAEGRSDHNPVVVELERSGF